MGSTSPSKPLNVPQGSVRGTRARRLLEIGRGDRVCFLACANAAANGGAIVANVIAVADFPALTDEQSARALNRIFMLANNKQDVRDHIHQLVTDMTAYKALIRVAIGDEEPRDLQFESLPLIRSEDAV